SGDHRDLHSFPTRRSSDLEVGEHLGTVGREVGTVTGRSRRCGWFDAALVRQSVALNGIAGIALTKLDVLDGLKTLKICTGYEARSEEHTSELQSRENLVCR